MYEVKSLWEHPKSSACLSLIELFKYPWQALPHIKEFISLLSSGLSSDEYEIFDGNIFISKSSAISDKATVIGPCIIGSECEIRPGAFIRGNAIIGNNCVIGNSTEIKNSILFDSVQVPHFNYVGDSILGYKTHFGAGVITSNVKSDKTLINLKIGGETINTGLKKFGAIIGDCVEIGCNTVLNPGTIIGKNSTVYPLSSVRGCIPEKNIYKSKDNIITKE